jgi:hypothetical protein
VFVNLRRITVSALAALGLLLVGCSTSAQQARTAQELEVREAIVGYQIASWDLRADVYFLEIESKKSATGFFGQIQGHSAAGQRGKCLENEKRRRRLSH